MDFLRRRFTGIPNTSRIKNVRETVPLMKAMEDELVKDDKLSPYGDNMLHSESSKELSKKAEITVTCLDINADNLKSLVNMANFIFSKERENKFVQQNEFSMTIQENQQLTTQKINNYKSLFIQTCKFFLLKGTCKKFLLSGPPQRKIIFQPSTNHILFYQKENVVVLLNIYHFFFFVYQITPYISYRILKNVEEFYNNPDNSGYLIFFGNILQGGESMNRRSNSIEVKYRVGNLQKIMSQYREDGIIKLKLKNALLISVFLLVPGTTKIINTFNQMNKDILIDLQEKMIFISQNERINDNITLTTNRLKDITQMKIGYTSRIIDIQSQKILNLLLQKGIQINQKKSLKNIKNELLRNENLDEESRHLVTQLNTLIQLKEQLKENTLDSTLLYLSKMGLNVPKMREKKNIDFLQNIEGHISQLHSFEHQIKIFNFFKYTFNCIVLVKLLSSDKTNPTILPFNINLKILQNFDYLDDVYSNFINKTSPSNIRKNIRVLIKERISELT